MGPDRTEVSVAELFFHNHTRSAAASAGGARRTGGKAGGGLKVYVGFLGTGVGGGWSNLHGVISSIDVGGLARHDVWLRVGAALVLPVAGDFVGGLAGMGRSQMGVGESFMVMSGAPFGSLR